MRGWLSVKGVDLGSLRVPQTLWVGPLRRPTTQRTGLFLMALSWGYGGVDYKYTGMYGSSKRAIHPPHPQRFSSPFNIL